MKVVIIRHGKVDLEWRKWSTSAQFDAQCQEYDIAPLLPVSRELKNHVSEKIYVSTLPRTKQTSELLWGKRELITSPLLNEVPLKSSMDTNIKLPLWFWDSTGRMQWFFNSSRQQETKRETISRANTFVKMLLKKREDCTIVTHGVFMYVFVKVLKANGFKVDKTKINYSNLETIVAIL